jgi:anaphase-promoting complex subunit 3
MRYLERALKQTPNNVPCRYHKARLLFDTGRYEEALHELKELKLLAPDEAHVFFLLGRVHKKLNGDKNNKALINFNFATEIDPRGDQNQSRISEGIKYFN